MKFAFKRAVVLWLATGAVAQTPDTPIPDKSPTAGQTDTARASISLSPAVIMVRCKPGQGTTQTLTISNNTSGEVRFNLETQDVVVSDGIRALSPAGQIGNGIAATSVATPASVVVKAGESASVQVTFTLPPQTTQRAVVTFFRGILTAPGDGVVGLGASLGTLITFSLSTDFKLESGPVAASLQTPEANVILSQELHNTGTEPLVPKGIIVVLNASGKRVAKAPFKIQRLLPGERLVFAATNPAQLAPGNYRTLSSFEFERRVFTSAGEFAIP
ncbi:MAG: hypothetical protein ABSE57_06990 [Bryobacteraceae bacterium]|jgi:hypothetical protein